MALVIDQDTREVLFSKNDSAVLPIASLTKLMTGLVVSEAKLPMDEMITITQDDVDTEKGSSSRLRVGTMLTRGELLHLALMSSENRAAHALGRTYPGGLQRFRAADECQGQDAGHEGHPLRRAHRPVQPATSPAPRTWPRWSAPPTTTRCCANSPPRPSTRSPWASRTLQYNNTNRLVKNPDWEIGLQKTGYISEAGQCLVMQAKIAGRKLIMVFLDSAGKLSRIGDAERVRRWVESNPVVPSANPARSIRQVNG